MSTSHWRPENHSFSSMDSFETNLNQIEQTNQLLSNIEARLNNFFHRNPPKQNSPPHNHPSVQKDLTYQETHVFSLQTKPDPPSGVGNSMLSPILNKDLGQNFLSGDYDLNIKSINKHINVIDAPKSVDPATVSAERESLAYAYKPRESNKVDRSLSPAQSYEHSLHESSKIPPTRNSEKKNVQINSNKESHWAPNLASIAESERRTELSRQYDDLRERVSHVDHRFYERKIQILEQRLESADSEISTLVKAKGTLNGDIARLKAQLAEAQSRFLEDLNRSLKSQEERLRREFGEQEKYRETEARENMRYLERIEELTKENVGLKEDLELMRRQNEKVVREKEAQIQIERQKLEKSLANSMMSEKRESIEKKEESRIIAQEQLKGLVEALGMYKKELEGLKENNRLLQDQFESEIHELKEELHQQREYNGKLEEKIQAQNQVLVKFQDVALEASGRKENIAVSDREYDRPSVVKFELKEQGRMERSSSSPNKLGTEKYKTLEGESLGHSPSTGRVPFTNNEIKSGILNQRKGRGRDVLYKQMAELDKSPEIVNVPKSRSKTRSKSAAKGKVLPEEEVMRERSEGKIRKRVEKSPGTAYEEFEEELKRLKGVVSTKLAFKKVKKKDGGEKEKENVRGKKERKHSVDIRTVKDKEKEKSEKKQTVGSKGSIKTSPVGRRTQNLGSSLKAKGGKVK